VFTKKVCCRIHKPLNSSANTGRGEKKKERKGGTESWSRRLFMFLTCSIFVVDREYHSGGKKKRRERERGAKETHDFSHLLPKRKKGEGKGTRRGDIPLSSSSINQIGRKSVNGEVKKGEGGVVT